MGEAQMYLRYENSDYHGYEFDYQADFSQFLEEAKKNVRQVSQDTPHFQAGENKQFTGEKKTQKSWKSSLFSWLKTYKKSNSTKQNTKGTPIHKPTRRNFSGPVQRTQKPISGPLSGLFSSTPRVGDHEGPYMCLSRTTSNLDKVHYGPIYLVT